MNTRTIPCAYIPDRKDMSETKIRQFWNKVDKSPHPKGRWVWKGMKDQWGYGRVSFGMNSKTAYRKANRVAYSIHNGSVDRSMCVCHKCDNPPCVNPDHLWLGTNKENTTDMLAKGREASGDRSGAVKHPESRPKGSAQYNSKLKEADVIFIRNSPQRNCDLARMLGVHKCTIADVRARRQWKHLP